MILSKSELVNNINTEISDQSFGQISPYDIRHNLLDIIDSVHNLFTDQDINGKNLGTQGVRNSRLGIGTIENSILPGAINEDNIAIGYNALRSNFKGVTNTAIGSYALSCNVYGSGNIAIGYQALAGNTVGHTNIGIGSYALYNSKGGQNNLAIGRGAGYYIGKNTNNKLFIANHSVSSEYICDNPNGSGLTPLVYGDFNTKQFGINVNSLHANSSFQVSGNITPSLTDSFDVGINGYRWRYINTSSGVFYGNNLYIGRGFQVSGIAVSGNLIPSTDNAYVLGSNQNSWASGFFKDIIVTGVATINQLTYVNTNYVTDKTFYVALNNGNGYLSDEEIVNGGFGIKSSGSNPEYLRDYNILFYPASSGESCFEGIFNKSTWRTNTSFQVPTGGYIKTNSIVSYENESNCYGLHFNSGISYISRKNILNVNPGSSNGHIAGIGNINFIANSGSLDDFCLSVISLESGVNVSQRFLTGAQSREKDLANGNKDKLRGFEIKYIDDALYSPQGFLSDRLIIGSYNNTSEFVNGLTIMKDSEDGAVFGVTNISSITSDILPATIFNIRSDNEAILRVTAETNAYEKSALQLLGNDNCEISGVELAYLNNSGIADISMFHDENQDIFIRLNQPSGSIGILSSGITNEAITIGHSGISGLPVISLKDSTNIQYLQTEFIPTSGYGKLYNIYNNKSYANQYNDLKFLDPSGNIFDLVVNKYDNLDARSIYTDQNANTFGGYLCPSGRTNITGSISGNTAYGYQSLYGIISGSGNVIFGNNSASGIRQGNDNIVIGQSSFNTISSGNKNIVIGNRSFIRENLGSTSGNIIIGHDGVGNSTSGSYHFLLGLNQNTILLDGTLGPTNNDKKLILPSGGKIYLHNNNNTESLGIQNNIIEVIDSGGSDYPENSLIFKFTANESVNLLKLDHNSNPLTNAANYSSANRPYAELNGDLKIRGNISFSDGSSLGSSNFLTRIDSVESGIAITNSGIDALIIEGYALNTISPPSNGSSPTSGYIKLKNESWQDTTTQLIVNRDTTCLINSGDYVVAIKVNNQYRPIWINAIDTVGSCCIN